MDPNSRDSTVIRRSSAPLTRLSFCFLLLTLGAPGAHAASSEADLAQERLGLSRVSIQSLRVDGTGLRIPVELQGRRVTLSLTPSELRAPGFRVRVAANGAMHDVPAEAPASYRGTIEEMSGSVVGGTIRDHQLRLTLALADGRVFHVQPLSEVDVGADRSRHAIYAAEDAIEAEGTCAATGDGEIVPQGPDGPGGALGGPIRRAQIAFDADFEFYVLNGSSVSATVADIENVMAQVNAIYERDVAITHVITTILVRSDSNDPYTSTAPDTLLDQFDAHWSSAQTSVVRDVAHLMTGKNLNGSVIGIASVGTICSQTRGFGLSQSRYTSNLSRRSSLTAHELGHNWNARHCDAADPCNIMCSAINGCDGLGLPNFEPMAVDAITTFAASRSCLETSSVAVEEPAVNAGARFAAAAPTPFTDETALSFQLRQAGRAGLDIYDVAGHRVARLAHGVRAAGWHRITWNGLDDTGHRLGAGVYYARLEVHGARLTQKLVKLR